MKIRSLTSAALLFSLSVLACGGDNDSTGVDIIQSLSFSVDGGVFSGGNGGVSRSGSTVTLLATSTTAGFTRTLSISVPSAAVGTLTVGGAGSPSITYAEQSTGGTAKQWAAGNGFGGGTVVFTELSATKAVGTFLLTLPPITASGATATKTLTNGTFSLAF